MTSVAPYICDLYFPMWATPMFPLSGLIFWLGLMGFFGLAYASKNTETLHNLTGKYTRAAYPGPEMAEQFDQRWRDAFPGKPLRFILGMSWEAGILSFESEFQTLVLINGDFGITPWITAEDIHACGALAVWDSSEDMLPDLRKTWPEIKEQKKTLTEKACDGSMPIKQATGHKNKAQPKNAG